MTVFEFGETRLCLLRLCDKGWREGQYRSWGRSALPRIASISPLLTWPSSPSSTTVSLLPPRGTYEHPTLYHPKLLTFREKVAELLWRGRDRREERTMRNGEAG